MNEQTQALVKSDQRIMAALEAAKPKMADLNRHITPERMFRVMSMALYRTPALKECTPDSIAACMVQAAELGLEPGSVLQHAYLIPRKNKNLNNAKECTLVPSYRGLIELVRRSGKLKSISARVVYEKDQFELVYTADKPNVMHRPCLDGDAGKPRMFYAVAVMDGGAVEFEAMTNQQVEAIRSRSEAKDSGPWVSDHEEMAKKTVLKRLLKRLPVSTELARAIEIDNTDYIETTAVTMEGATVGKAEALKARLAAARPVDETIQEAEVVDAN